MSEKRGLLSCQISLKSSVALSDLNSVCMQVCVLLTWVNFLLVLWFFFSHGHYFIPSFNQSNSVEDGKLKQTLHIYNTDNTPGTGVTKYTTVQTTEGLFVLTKSKILHTFQTFRNCCVPANGQIHINHLIMSQLGMTATAERSRSLLYSNSKRANNTTLTLGVCPC